MKSIVEEIFITAQSNPDRLCIADINSEASYSEMWKLIKRLALQLKKLGADHDDYVISHCEQSYRFMVLNFACNLLGAVFVPIESKASDEFIRKVVAETESHIMISNTFVSDIIHTITYDELWDLMNNCDSIEGADNIDKVIDGVEFVFPKLSDTAEILYTTGTTGTSKGIEISHKNNVALAQNIAESVNMHDANVELLPLPLSHSHGLRCSYANYYRHGAIVILDGVSKIKNVVDIIEKYSVNAMDVSPMAMSMLFFMTKGKISEIVKDFDYIQVGTSALSDALIQQMREAFPGMHLYNSYGTTESGRSCMFDFGCEPDKKNCVGKPAVNAFFATINEQGEFFESSSEKTGLIACKGPMNMKGYFKNYELTRNVTLGEYILSNDEGYIDSEGYVYVLGRKDDVINYRGIKISPQEIEGIVMKSDMVEDCACTKVKNELVGEMPILYIQVKDKDSFDIDALKEYIRNNIDANKQPNSIEFIDKIPRTYNGKIQRNKL